MKIWRYSLWPIFFYLIDCDTENAKIVENCQNWPYNPKFLLNNAHFRNHSLFYGQLYKQVITQGTKKMTCSVMYVFWLILDRWFRIWYSFFRLGQKFAVLPVWRFFGQKSRFRIFFENLKISETFFFVFVKKVIEIGPTDLEISHFKVKKSSKFHDF